MGKTSQQSAEKLLTAFSLLTMVKTVKEITYDMVTCHQKCATTQPLLKQTSCISLELFTQGTNFVCYIVHYFYL